MKKEDGNRFFIYLERDGKTLKAMETVEREKR